MSKNTRTLLSVLGLVFCMLGLAFASVPLYDLFCRVTGFGGTTQVSERLPGVVLDRRVTVKFNSDISNNLFWQFQPDDREITVQLGQQGLTSYTAENIGASASAGTAVYNVTPPKVGKYFHKIQCFCFDEQLLKPGQSMPMPVMFYVDPAMHEDRSMDDVKTITLSYTFFPVESQELDDALEAFYNDEQPAIESGTSSSTISN